ncbi:bromodomain adjacent to zinc finger domain protein 1A isoform X2 [Orussus abietinus]|uniref:bromodomain adjacent to zinc finger domain protein 1A isoform X2 n=1 Tax=Orussus abietinus TaxID=222816 RepID=UPI000625F00D|nr:bromodomain adjacent to zinc finger domain protein 1A isoform X2 [Orussus abietinus]
MPLLRKEPFKPLYVSSDFRDDDEVFHCEVTNEIFKDYNEFCERVILCSSMVWSCSITGQSNMTFEEALQCEENAKRSLKEFPMELRIPIIYLANKTIRTSFTEMLEDVYQFVRDRYFVGEMVEASFTENSWSECHVLQIIPPTEQQIASYKPEIVKSLQDRQYYPPAKLFRYEVEQLDSGDSDVSQLMIVEATQVRRRKQNFSRERNKMFLRQLCQQNTNGIWTVKESVLQKYGIHKVRFDALFAGPLPDFMPRAKKVVRQKQESITKYLTADTSKHRAFAKVNDDEMMVKKYRRSRMNGKEELKAKAKEEKAKLKEENKEHKKAQKLKTAALTAYIKQWNKPRDDLECEDPLPIPKPVPIKCCVPNEKFGDLAMILEFLHFFYEELEVNSYFPGGFNFDLLEKALIEKEISGPWNDLLQLLLANIFKYQAEEEDEIHATKADLNDVGFDQEISSMAKAVKMATIALTFCKTHQGCQLSELTLDHVTVSEILRQHLLSSGGRISEVASKWRYSQRGGYTNHDDPALLLRMNEAQILRTLGHRNVCEFDVEDKLKVITCLISQLLTFASVRDVIEERYEKLHQARKELKSFMIAEQKKEKEEKEKLRERIKEGKLEEEEQKLKKVTRNTPDEDTKKVKYESKLKKLKEASKRSSMMLYLGSDRAYRRYWRLLSIPGLFVEYDEKWSGNCLVGGTPYNPELRDSNSIYAYIVNKFEDEFNDKENSIKRDKKSPKKVFFSKNQIKSTKKDLNSKKDNKHDLNEDRRNLMVCTGDKTCPVHWKKFGPMWSFYGRAEDIDVVIESLNKRGTREGELRNNLLQEKASLVEVINDCPRNKLNSEVFSETTEESVIKTVKKNKYDNVNMNYPPDVPINDVLELTLRDYILDLEEKIKVGGLGSLKVINRDSWRSAISRRSYDKQCEKLVYGVNETEADVASNASVDKLKNETKSSRPGTPDSDVGSLTIKTYRDPGMYLGPPAEGESVPDLMQQTAIKQMACAILQLLHAIEPKYLKKPLGPDEKDKKWPSEEIKERWEHSLMFSTSWSQLFVHLSTLENSVAWGRSALNAQCRICRRRRDAEKMLLCDNCNKGHHLYCLKPKLNAVPEGDWFCTTCRPREVKPKKKIKQRRKFEDEVEEETALTKETRHNRAKRVTSNDEAMASEGEDDESSEDKSETLNKSVALCALCGSGGKVIHCDTCPKCYHIECIEPPLLRPPRGKWICSPCRGRTTRNGARHVRARERERERETERLCAAAARSRIHGFAKSLLTRESTDWDDSTSDEAESRTTRRGKKRQLCIEEEPMENKMTVKGCVATLQEVLADITHHKDSWPFLSPVTPDEVPDYHDYISNPMDFGTMKYKLTNGDYKTLLEFYQDCLLVFDNCQTYNQEHSHVYRAGMRLQKYFEKRCKELNLDYDEEKVRESVSKKPKIVPSNGISCNGSKMESDEGEVH